MVDAIVVTERPERRRLVPVPVIAAIAALGAIALVIVLLNALGVFGERAQSPADKAASSELVAAQSAYNSGDFAGAETALVRLVSENPDDLAARRALALAFAAQGKNDAAIEQYAAVVAADDTDHESFYRIAVIERLIGKTDAALAHFEAAVAIEPQSLYADELARTYMQVGRYADAIAAWEKALASDALDEAAKAGIYAAMADAYAGARDYDGARESLEKALALTPNDANLKARLESLTK
jgi:tetratricopeptide (TPR) repeat protein